MGKFLNQCLIAILPLAFQKFSGGISCMVEACVRTESLRVGLSESVFPDHDPGGGYNPGSRHCHPDLRGFPQLQPHLHVLCTDGIFYESCTFRVAPPLDTKPLEKIFQHKVLGMLLRKGKIWEEEVKLILSYRHSGFTVHCGHRILPGYKEAIGNLARYVVRAYFSQERISYIPDESRVVYQSKDGNREKIFDAL